LTLLYPVFLRVDRLRCVLVGGGAVAARKAHGLIEAGADITVVSPALHPDLQALSDAERIRWIQREAEDEDFADTNLVFLATADGATNARLEIAARKYGALVNRADSPDDGTFHVPAVIRRGDVAVAVSTGGLAPGIAQVVRDDIGSVLTETRLALLEVIAEARKALHDAGGNTDSDEWRDLLNDMVLLDYVTLGQRDLAVRHIMARVKSGSREQVAP
jgi:precorrin-2 dehydrogenase / sirohydrochlorin ferrochelatase